jgi:hypothetical protein
VRNAQTGAPELVARIQTQKRARRAEVEWPTRYTKAKRSRGLMAGLPFFGENAKFSVRAWHVHARLKSGGGEGIRSIEYVGGRVDNAVQLSA